jgi:CRISPR-associated endonuclease Cas2
VYDISDDLRRETIIQILKDASLTRIQKSVFCGKLSRQRKKDLLAKIKNIICVDDDSFYLIMNCNLCFSQTAIIGQGFDIEYISNKKESMVL